MDTDRNGMVQMKALALFTRNSPTTGTILHGDDREKADVKARFPYVTPADAEYLEKEGLAEVYDGKLPKEGGPGDGTGLTVDERSGQQVEENIDAENSVERTTGLSTRDTTAFPDAPHVMAQSRTGREMVVGDIRQGPASETEAPAGGGGRASRSSSGSGKSGSGEGNGEKPLSKMNATDLQAEADKMEPKVTTALDGDGKEIPFAEATNKEKAAAIQRARDASKQ